MTFPAGTFPPGTFPPSTFPDLAPVTPVLLAGSSAGSTACEGALRIVHFRVPRYDYRLNLWPGDLPTDGIPAGCDFAEGTPVASLLEVRQLDGSVSVLPTYVLLLNEGGHSKWFKLVNLGAGVGQLIFDESLLPAITDQLVKVSAGDTASGRLEDKIKAGSGVTFTKVNAGGNENIRVDVPAATSHAFFVGSGGSDFGVSSVSGNVTYSLPSAGVGIRGAVTSEEQVIDGLKHLIDDLDCGRIDVSPFQVLRLSTVGTSDPEIASSFNPLHDPTPPTRHKTSLSFEPAGARGLGMPPGDVSPGCLVLYALQPGGIPAVSPPSLADHVEPCFAVLNRRAEQQRGQWRQVVRSDGSVDTYCGGLFCGTTPGVPGAGTTFLSGSSAGSTLCAGNLTIGGAGAPVLLAGSSAGSTSVTGDLTILAPLLLASSSAGSTSCVGALTIGSGFCTGATLCAQFANEGFNWVSYFPDVGPQFNLFGGGNWTLTGGALHLDAGTGTPGVWTGGTAEGGLADGTVGVDLVYGASDSFTAGLVFRYSNSSNYWLLYFDTTSGVRGLHLVKVVAGAPTEVDYDGSGGGFTAGQPYRLTLTMSGNSLSAGLETNGGVNFNVAGTDSFNASATRYGPAAKAAAGLVDVAWDNFRADLT